MAPYYPKSDSEASTESTSSESSTSSNLEHDDEEIKILVTGFGPFREQYPRNPSSLIAHSLPSTITLPSPDSKSPPTRVRLIPYPEPIHVSFLTVRNLIPSIYSSPSSPHYDPAYARCSYVLHIGMASSPKEYRVERLGHKDGYDKNQKTGKVTKDVDGRTLRECEEIMGLASGEYWAECPNSIQTTLDVDDIVSQMHMDTDEPLPKGITVSPSDDAGHYLCDFIYFSSLAHFWRENGIGGERPVVFLHVPPESDEETLEDGRKVVLALVRAVVANELDRRGLA